MPKPEAKTFLDRHRLMNQREEEELRATSPETSLQQLESMYASIDVFGWREALREGESELRERWARAKEKHGRPKK
jgi:hypothetical protein